MVVGWGNVSKKTVDAVQSYIYQYRIGMDRRGILMESGDDSLFEWSARGMGACKKVIVILK